MKIDKGVQKTIIIVGGILILSLILIFTIKSFLPDKDSIQINGESTMDVTPDIITIYYNIQTKGETSKQAEDKNSKILNNLTYQIGTIEFDKTELKTQSFNINPEYNWNNGKQTLIGYQATHSLKIELSINQTDKVGDLIDAGTNAGAGIGYINFELSTKLEQEKKAEAIKLASQDARIKAEALADGFNKKIGKLVSVSLNNWNYSPWRVYDSYGAEPGIVSMEAKESITNITPGDQQVSAYINAVYKLK